jgi:hypothetical protein
MTAGFLPEAKTAFAAAAKLQPADTVSQQLYELTSASATGEEEAKEEPEAETETEAPEQVPAPAIEDLRGSWVADRGDKGTITLEINPEDKFTWKFTRGEKSDELTGQASISEGLLVLAAEQAQMVGAADLAEDKKKMNFMLAGGPPGDPGVNFVKKS